MSSIECLCPSCRERYFCQPAHLGGQIRCNRCETVFVLAAPRSQPQPRPPSRSRTIPQPPTTPRPRWRRQAATILLIGGLVFLAQSPRQIVLSCLLFSLAALIVVWPQGYPRQPLQLRYVLRLQLHLADLLAASSCACLVLLLIQLWVDSPLSGPQDLHTVHQVESALARARLLTRPFLSPSRSVSLVLCLMLLAIALRPSCPWTGWLPRLLASTSRPRRIALYALSVPAFFTLFCGASRDQSLARQTLILHESEELRDGFAEADRATRKAVAITAVQHIAQQLSGAALPLQTIGSSSRFVPFGFHWRDQPTHAASSSTPNPDDTRERLREWTTQADKASDHAEENDTERYGEAIAAASDAGQDTFLDRLTELLDWHEDDPRMAIAKLLTQPFRDETVQAWMRSAVSSLHRLRAKGMPFAAAMEAAEKQSPFPALPPALKTPKVKERLTRALDRIRPEPPPKPEKAASIPNVDDLLKQWGLPPTGKLGMERGGNWPHRPPSSLGLTGLAGVGAWGRTPANDRSLGVDILNGLSRLGGSTKANDRSPGITQTCWYLCWYEDGVLVYCESTIHCS